MVTKKKKKKKKKKKQRRRQTCQNCGLKHCNWYLIQSASLHQNSVKTFYKS